MFPTFPGKGEWVLAEALPGLAERVKPGELSEMQGAPPVTSYVRYVQQ